MKRIKELIHEIHRRSLWQVTGIFVAASWGVLQVVEVLTDTAGLPDWTPTMALVLLLIGLPMCLATAFVQEGMPGQASERQDEPRADRPDSPSETAGSNAAPSSLVADAAAVHERDRSKPATPRRIFTWRNAILGGAGAFTLLGVAVAAYFLMWSTGIGPVGNLVAQGVIRQGDRVVLADFDDDTGEGLGTVVTEALRVDLGEASVLALVDPAEIGPTLRRMQRSAEAPFDGEAAREVALRDGIAAVIDGSIARVGEGYMVTAALREAESGRALASFRVPAASSAELIAAIDKLSQNVREKSGESLRNIRAGAPLERVTTSSLEALRLYTEANRLYGQDDTRAIDLLRRAVEIDPEFAFAWRKLAAAYFNALERGAERHAATEAFRHRARLTERERLATEGYYYASVERDPRRSIDAYVALVELQPDDPVGLNNLGNAYAFIGEVERAIETFRKAVGGPGRTTTAYSNLVLYLARMGRIEEASAALVEWEEAYPDAAGLPDSRIMVTLLAGGTVRAEALARERLDDGTLPPLARATAAIWLAKIGYRRGRFDEARGYAARAIDIGAVLDGIPGLAPRLLTARMEGLIDDRVRAAQRLRRIMEDERAWGALVEGNFTEQFAHSVATVGDPNLFDLLENRLRGQGVDPADVGESELALLRLVSGSPASDGALGDVMDRLLEQHDCVTVHCYRTERALAFARADDAARALPFYEAMARSASDISVFTGMDDLHAMLRLGGLYEAVGDTAAAVEAYRRVTDLWADADAAGRQQVAAFQARIDALGGS